jgi:hypothetical protein
MDRKATRSVFWDNACRERTFVNRAFSLITQLWTRPLAVCVISSRLLLDVRLAILSIGKSAATDLAGFVGCVPAILNASPIGFRFLNVTWT